MSVRIAFASTDGSYIDQHFGNARIFQVFDLSGSSFKLVESRRTKASCQGSCEGGFEHLFKALEDCDAVFAGKIGPGAAAFMIGRGKRVFEANGPVEDIMEQLMADQLLELRRPL
ncbi:MAG: NifB/NifX family molybdenum-iron cluster-binding protein [Peptococcaceae bacterium]|nr:NifB/NifX family molybdenum-iron cluster-binding protein [Peptococcaceae bacterium]